MKTLKDALAGERLLRDALVAFQPLDDKPIERREQFGEHLDELRRLLGQHRIEAGTLSIWSETEQALGISESQRKAKVSILRLDPELRDAVRELPAEHAIQISRLPDRERQAELIERTPELTHRQVHDAVERLRKDPELGVEEALSQPAGAAGDDVAFDAQLASLADLCRQLVRLIVILQRQADADRRTSAERALVELRSTIDDFMEAA